MDLHKSRARTFKSTFSTPDLPETSKKAGWHRVSLGDETETRRISETVCKIKTLDKNPRIVFRIRYQPAELLRANGILPMTTATSSANTAEPVTDQGSSSQNPTSRKRTRCAEPLDQFPKRPKPSSTNNRDPEPVPSSSIAHTRPKIDPDAALGDVVVKNEADEEPGETDDSDEELQALQNSLQLIQSQIESKKKRKNRSGPHAKTRVKPERAASPIVVGAGNGELIDLTLESV